jgi:hypothetical protein
MLEKLNCGVLNTQLGDLDSPMWKNLIAILTLFFLIILVILYFFANPSFLPGGDFVYKVVEFSLSDVFTLISNLFIFIWNFPLIVLPIVFLAFYLFWPRGIFFK